MCSLQIHHLLAILKTVVSSINTTLPKVQRENGRAVLGVTSCSLREISNSLSLVGVLPLFCRRGDLTTLVMNPFAAGLPTVPVSSLSSVYTRILSSLTQERKPVYSL